MPSDYDSIIEKYPRLASFFDVLKQLMKKPLDQVANGNYNKYNDDEFHLKRLAVFLLRNLDIQVSDKPLVSMGSELYG